MTDQAAYIIAGAFGVTGLYLVITIERGVKAISDRLAANYTQLERIGSHFDILNGKAGGLLHLLEHRRP